MTTVLVDKMKSGDGLKMNEVVVEERSSMRSSSIIHIRLLYIHLLHTRYPAQNPKSKMLLLLPRNIHRQEISYDKRGTSVRLASYSYVV